MAQALVGSSERCEEREGEATALSSLQRGVYARRPLGPEDQLVREMSSLPCHCTWPVG